jgi:uncharacterized protein
LIKSVFVCTLTVIIIDFDPKKNAANLDNPSRRLDFRRAEDFDFTTANIAEDVRYAYPERRFVAVGLFG